MLSELYYCDAYEVANWTLGITMRGKHYNGV